MFCYQKAVYTINQKNVIIIQFIIVCLLIEGICMLTVNRMQVSAILVSWLYRYLIYLLISVFHLLNLILVDSECYGLSVCLTPRTFLFEILVFVNSREVLNYHIVDTKYVKKNLKGETGVRITYGTTVYIFFIFY